MSTLPSLLCSIVDKKALRESLTEQLLEIELLKCIYACNGEIDVCEFILETTKLFLCEDDDAAVAQCIDFTIDTKTSVSGGWEGGREGGMVT